MTIRVFPSFFTHLRIGDIDGDDEDDDDDILDDDDDIPDDDKDEHNALWSETNKNRDVITGPLARPFAPSRSPLSPLTRSLAPDCLLCLRPLLRSLVCSLAHSPHSLARGKVNY